MRDNELASSWIALVTALGLLIAVIGGFLIIL